MPRTDILISRRRMRAQRQHSYSVTFLRFDALPSTAASFRYIFILFVSTCDTPLPRHMLYLLYA